MPLFLSGKVVDGGLRRARMTTFAVFDLDGTITRGDTFVAYALYVLRRRPWRLLHCLPLAWATPRFALGRIDNDEAKRWLLAAVAGGCRREDIAAFTSAFVAHRAQAMVKPSALRRIAEHAGRGDVLVMATAGLDIYAEALGATLGFAHVLATKAAWRDGRLVFGLDGPNLKGEAKLAAVRALVDRLGGGNTVAYSDHDSDVPLLRWANRGVAVDPHRRLAGAGFRVEYWNKPK